jgi:head-tail adaptor
MIDKIELKLIDDKGNYSIAHIDYSGYTKMLITHEVDMVHDVLDSMIENYIEKGKMEIDIKKHSGASHYVSNEEADEDATGKHIQSRSNK